MATDQKKSYSSILTCLFAVLVFYFNNETLSNNLCLVMSQPCRIVAVLGFLLLGFCVLLRRVLPAWPTVWTILLAVQVILAYRVDGGQTNGYFLVLMNLMIAYCVVYLLDFRQFQSVYVLFMAVISGASLIGTYLLKPLLRVVPVLFPQVYNSVGNCFIDAHLCYIMKETGYYRNFGIFREPGIFATFLCLAFLFLLEDRSLSKRPTMTIALLSAGIISTFSTVGYLTMAAVFLIHLLGRRGLNRRSTVWLGGVMLVLLFPVFWSVTDDNLFGQVFQKLSSSHSSMRYRMETILNGLTVSWNNSFLGAGILRGTEQMREMNTMLRYHNTSTVIAMLVYFGLGYLGIFLALLTRLFHRIVGNGLYLLPVFLLLNAQQFLYNPIWYALMLYGAGTKMNLGEEHERLMDHQ